MNTFLARTESNSTFFLAHYHVGVCKFRGKGWGWVGVCQPPPRSATGHLKLKCMAGHFLSYSLWLYH